MIACVAVDVGQSGIRVIDDAGAVREHAGGVRPLVDAASLAEISDALVGLLPAPASAIDTVAVGLSGFVSGSAMPDRLAASLVAAGARTAVVAADAVTAYLGTIGERAGVVAICGTGVAVLGWDGRTVSRRVDARGSLLGDHGSGFWIGRRGLRSALDATEGRGGSSALARASTRLGSPADIYAAASAGGARYVAGFAPDVLACAADGDPESAHIVTRAGEEVVTSIAAARVSDGRLGFTGGLLRSPVFVDALTRALRAAGLDDASIDVRPDAALEGARILASSWRRVTTAFDELVTVKERPAP